MENNNVIKLKPFNYSDEKFKPFMYGMNVDVQYSDVEEMTKDVREIINNFTFKIKTAHKRNSEALLQKNRLQRAKLCIDFVPDAKTPKNSDIIPDIKTVSCRYYGLCNQYFNAQISEDIRTTLTNILYSKIASEVDIFPGRRICVLFEFTDTDWTVPSPVFDDGKFYDNQYNRIFSMNCTDFTKDAVVEKEPTVITDADIATD